MTQHQEAGSHDTNRPTSGPPQLQRSWAGHYAITPDENSILGQHPEYPRLFMAGSYSGHGVMLTPATGKALSELTRETRYGARYPPV